MTCVAGLSIGGTHAPGAALPREQAAAGAREILIIAFIRRPDFASGWNVCASMAIECELVCVMNQPVEDGIGEGGVW